MSLAVWSGGLIQRARCWMVDAASAELCQRTPHESEGSWSLVESMYPRQGYLREQLAGGRQRRREPNRTHHRCAVKEQPQCGQSADPVCKHLVDNEDAGAARNAQWQ